MEFHVRNLWEFPRENPVGMRWELKFPSYGNSVNHSVSKINHRQLNIPDNAEGFSYGKLTHKHIKNVWGKVKSGIQSQDRFQSINGRYNYRGTIL